MDNAQSLLDNFIAHSYGDGVTVLKRISAAFMQARADFDQLTNEYNVLRAEKDNPQARSVVREPVARALITKWIDDLIKAEVHPTPMWYKGDTIYNPEAIREIKQEMLNAIQVIESDKIEYKCGECGVSGVKLWRRYQTFMENQKLFCAKCAGKDQKVDVGSMDAQGKVVCEVVDGHAHRIDQIGWLVPACPADNNTTFWGYTSVPQEVIEWWKALPNSKEGECPNQK